MKVGVTAEGLNRAGAGITTYSYNLIKELIHTGDCEPCLIEYADSGSFPELPRMIVPNPLKKISNLYLWHPYLTKKLNDTGNQLDIVHSLNQGPSFFRLKKHKYVITIHDLLPLVHPGLRPFSVYLTYKALLPRTLKHADMIISDSQSTKNDLIRIFGLPEEKIKVVHLGVDHSFRRACREEIEAVRSKYRLDSPFVLYLGGLAVHKNVPTLIRSFSSVKERNPDHKLVITGTKRWGYAEVFKEIERSGLQNDVIFLGYVPDSDLPALYSAADVFVNPSIYEGFGLPTLEAMACGTPVVSSNTSSFPEVVGDAGIMVDPARPDLIAEKINQVLSDDGQKKRLVSMGTERAKRFTWKRCAQETYEVYREVCSMK